MNWTLLLCIFLLLTCSYAKDQSKPAEESTWCWKEYTAVGVLTGAAAVAAAPFVLSAAGFTAGGVAAGSIAAGIQSAVYGGAVASTSTFAALQSAGAAGIGAKTAAGLFTAAAGAATYLKNKWYPCEEGPKCSSDKE
ncbi:hypothetical protein ACROYT_G040309 [Oculina patagonica]